MSDVNKSLLSRWHGMISRSRESFWKKSPAYTGVSIADEFKSYPAFYEWAVRQIGFDAPGWHLDKDILVKNNRVYGPDLCVFVPREINALLPSNRVNRGKWPVGVNFGKDRRVTFRAECSVNGKNVKKSGFKTAEEAFDAYKEMKEANIKRVAEKYRSVIDQRTYAALVAYQVHITD